MNTSTASPTPDITEFIEEEEGYVAYYKTATYQTLHRVGGPAMIWANGDEHWIIDGKLHRDDGPAVIEEESEQWYQNGKLHRVDGPATILQEGGEYVSRWYKNGELHREDGPAVEWVDGSGEWHLNGEWHRLDGPAIIWANSAKFWYAYGQPHRIDGPVVELVEKNSEDNSPEYALFGEYVTELVLKSFQETIYDKFGKENIKTIPYDVLKSIFESISNA